MPNPKSKRKMDYTDKIYDKSAEPMDVDMSNSSVKSMDISYNESPNCSVKIEKTFTPVKIKQEVPDQDVPNVKAETETPRPVRKYHIKMNPKPTPAKPYFKYTLIIPVVIVAIISIIAFNMLNLKCCALDVDLVQKRLSLNLFGQSEVTNEISKTLRSEARTKILFFYGGTGVGKTHAASLLLEGLWGYSNIFHFTMPSFQSILHDNLMLGMRMCSSSIIVVDDLSTKDIAIKDEISYLIQKSEASGKNVTVILIYNCDNVSQNFERKCESSFLNSLKQSFEDVKALKKYIKFNYLQQEHLKMCIKHELQKEGLLTLDIEKVARSFDVTQDGCKGVYTKMKLINNS